MVFLQHGIIELALRSVKKSFCVSDNSKWCSPCSDLLAFVVNIAMLTLRSGVFQQGKHSRVYCTASFSVSFPHDADVCYLAFHYPYTYTRMRVSFSGWSGVVCIARVTLHSCD